jgi:hypothetical protein
MEQRAQKAHQHPSADVLALTGRSEPRLIPKPVMPTGHNGFFYDMIVSRLTKVNLVGSPPRKLLAEHPLDTSLRKERFDSVAGTV